jgi:hypothetical protein
MKNAKPINVAAKALADRQYAAKVYADKKRKAKAGYMKHKGGY